MYGIHYSQICGRVIGYQFGDSNAFHWPGEFVDDIDTPYIDGVSVTYGTPHSISGPLELLSLTLIKRRISFVHVLQTVHRGRNPLLNMTTTASPDVLSPAVLH